MTGGGGEASPPAPPSPAVNGGDFLLQLLRNPPHHPPVLQSQPPPQSPSQALPHDPAVAAVGPSVPFPPLFQSPSNGRDYASHLPWTHAPPLFAPHNFYHHQGFLQNPNPNPSSVPNFGFNQTHQHAVPRGFGASGEGFVKPGIIGASSKSNPIHELEQNLIFRSVQRDSLINDNFNGNLSGKVETFARNDRESSSGNPWRLNSMEDKLENSNNLGQNQIKLLGGVRGHEKQKNSSSGGDGGGLGWGRQLQGGNFRGSVPPPGFASKPSGGNKEYAERARDFEHNMDKGKNNFVELNHRGFGSNNVHERDGKYLPKNGRNQYVVSDVRGLSRQLDSPGPPPGSNLQSVLASDVEDSMSQLQGEDVKSGEEIGAGVMTDKYGRTSARGQTELDDLEERLISSLGLEDESDEKSDKKKHQSSRDKDYRSDKRGAFILGQRVRMLKRQITCRGDINRMNAAFLAIYESLIPTEDEKLKQKQLLALLDKIVRKEWPDARLYVYGSCANAFGFSKSDIDICLAIEDANIDKAEVLLKLADMLQAEKLQNVQALTRARVPIVKLMDPETGISCDICVNNVLAVVNTKLLRDYAQIDVRLRQLAFIVKHWAKLRGVNVTYQGTLSSYAYVLMCIHFLQQRRPAILPCLQGMEATYSVTVDSVECAFFDKVEKLCGFGSLNGESLPRLVWAFFNYWAYWHDYANDVVSVRTGTLLSKRAKDWTRRIGNDRHLICIEDPFEVSHDLGRVVDKFSIRVLREEFERAAEIMQCDSNPCVRLFEPYIPS